LPAGGVLTKKESVPGSVLERLEARRFSTLAGIFPVFQDKNQEFQIFHSFFYRGPREVSLARSLLFSRKEEFLRFWMFG